MAASKSADSDSDGLGKNRKFGCRFGIRNNTRRLVARTYWAAVRSDAAVEAGGGEAGQQTDGTRRLNRPPPHAASYLSFTLPRDKTMPPCYIINPL